MSDLIKSPYKIRKQETREVCFDVSITDFNELKFRLPRHGAIDAILANLYYQFVQELKAKIPLALNTQEQAYNEQLIARAISTLNFTV